MIARFVRDSACAALGIIVTGAALHAMAPLPTVVLVSEKLRFIERHAGEFDTLFLGSSRTYRQISPQVFDSLTRENGKPTRSFNAGIDGMFAPEDSFFAEQALRRTRGLRWVFIEGSAFPKRTAPLYNTKREAYWHDARRTALLWKFYFAPGAPVRESSVKFAEHLRLTISNSLAISRGEALPALLLGEDDAAVEANVVGPASDGFAPILRSGAALERGVAEFQERFAEDRSAKGPAAAFDAATEANLAMILKAVRDAGATPVLFFPPSTGAAGALPQERGLRVLDLREADRFPELFLPGNRVDSEHLNAAGAEAFTRRLAQLFLSTSPQE